MTEATATVASQPAGERIPHGDLIDELQGREPVPAMPHIIDTRVIDAMTGWSWSVGTNSVDRKFTAYVHWPEGDPDMRPCRSGRGDTPQKALDAAYAEAWAISAESHGVPGMGEPVDPTDDERAEAERENAAAESDAAAAAYGEYVFERDR